MKLLIKQRVFSWSDTYDVYDEWENKKYFVKAEILSLAHTIHLYQCNTGYEVGQIKQKVFSLAPQFYVEMNGREIGRINKKLTLFHPRYDIEYNGWTVEGDFVGWNYNVYSGSYPVMSIQKEYFHWGDTYVLNFGHEEDELMGLLLVIAIDAANRSNNN